MGDGLSAELGASGRLRCGGVFDGRASRERSDDVAN
jgi:hypothetical protein